MEACRLCQSPDAILIYTSSKSREFYQCKRCGYTQVHSQNFVSTEDEKNRYLLHNNDVESEGYQNYLKPIIGEIFNRQKPTDQGLDYGSGPSSVVVHLLHKKSYQIKSYDPLFYNNSEILKQTYDFVVCTEVVEHFQNPIQEFLKILQLLNPQAHLYLKTEMTDLVQDFPNWHYHRDFTHVGFFSQKSFQFLEDKLPLKLIKFDSQFVIFNKTS